MWQEDLAAEIAAFEPPVLDLLAKIYARSRSPTIRLWVDDVRGRVGAFAARVKQYADTPQVGAVTITSAVPTPNFTPPDTYQATAVVLSVPHPVAQGGELIGRTLSWSSSNTGVFTVNSSSGLVTAVGAGTATLTATCEGVGGTQSVSVASPAATVATVTVTPTTLAGQVAGTGTLSAVVKDASNNVLLNRTVTWASSDTNKCTVSADSGTEAHSCTVAYVATGGSPTVTATCETVNSSAVAVTITAAPAAGDFRTFTDTEMQYMCGPLPVDGKYTEPGMQNLESVMASRLNEIYDRLHTQIVNNSWVAGTGTLSIGAGGTAITGAGGATFASNRAIRWVDGTQSAGYVYGYTINPSGSNATLGGYNQGSGSWTSAANPGVAQTNTAYEIANTASIPNGGGVSLGDWDGTYNYYDPAAGVYQHAAKKGSGAAFDATILSKARDIADTLSKLPLYGDLVAVGPTGPNIVPRQVALMSKIIRALDGKSYRFANIRKYVTAHDATWLARYIAGGPLGNSPSSWFVREGAYILIYEAMLGAVDPDGTQRTNYLNLAISRAIDPVIRFQDSYGRWKQMTNAQDGEWVTTAAGGTNYVAAAQPFINALVIHGLIATHRAMRKAGRTGGADAANYAAIGNAIILGCDHLYLAYRSAAHGFHADVRNMPYWTGDAGQLNRGTTAFHTVPAPDGDGVFAVQRGPVVPPNAWAWDPLTNDRQGNADSVFCHAYAYWLIQNHGYAGTASKYLGQAKEQLASCLQFQAVNPTVYSSYWYYPQTLKNLGQHVGVGQMLKAAAYLMGDGSIDF